MYRFDDSDMTSQECYPCASLLKPLYCWVTPEAASPDKLKSVIISHNRATDRVVNHVGLKTTLSRIGEKTGVHWEEAQTWGQVLVTEEEVKKAYEALAQATDKSALQVLNSMRTVVPWQRFGAPAGAAVKAGWDLKGGKAFTHRVTLVGKEVEVLLTATEVDEEWQALWKHHGRAGDARQVAALHQELWEEQGLL